MEKKGEREEGRDRFMFQFAMYFDNFMPAPF